MRLYENIIIRNPAIFDLPVKQDQKTKDGQKDSKQSSYLERIFRQLVVFDNLPSTEQQTESVFAETRETLNNQNLAFENSHDRNFQEFVSNIKQISKWNKIKQDRNYYIEGETKRRNKDNPYHPKTLSAETFENLPDFSRSRKNQPWQFDQLLKEVQNLVSLIKKEFQNQEQSDKDIVKIKVNSILIPERIIFALSGDNLYEYLEPEINIINLKIILDAYKQAEIFANRLIEGLIKISWRETEKTHGLIGDTEKLLEKIKTKIAESEKRLMLAMGPIY